MKMKSIFVSMLAILALASCNNEDESVSPPSTGQAELNGGFITVDIPKPATSRASVGPGSVGGLPVENTVGNVYVVTFDANYSFANSYELALLDSENSETSYLAKTKAIKLSNGAKYMFVVLNAPDKVIAKFNAASNATHFDDIKGIVAGLAVSEVTVDNRFTMVSAGDLTQTDGSNGLTVIGTTYKTADDAEAAANRKSISVDRIVAKFKISGMTPASVKGGTFSEAGWALNVENKATTLYSELVSFGGTSEKTASRYRMDHNWNLAAFDTIPANDGDLAAYKALIDANFNVLYNADIASIIFNPVHTGDQWQYIFENTMSAEQQLVDRTTNIIFKANYRPSQVSSNADGTTTVAPAKDESYFKYVGRLYNFTGISAVYTLAEEAIVAADAILGGTGTQDEKDAAQANKDKALATIADFDEVAVKVLGPSKTWKADVTSLAVLNDVANAGNKAELCKLRFYHKAINFYRGVIKHDYRLGTMELGKFGVVRNNAYTLSVESIAGPGEPWIPGPTVPEGELPGGGGSITPDEEGDKFIAVTITVNDWTTWSQGFDM